MLSAPEALELRATMLRERAEWLVDKDKTMRSLENLTNQTQMLENEKIAWTNKHVELESAGKALEEKVRDLHAMIGDLKKPKPAPPKPLPRVEAMSKACSFIR